MEKLERALLNSVSHSLRTPLASIIGALTSLADDEDLLSPSARADLLTLARDQALYLDGIVRQLLDLSRLQAGVLQPRKETCDFAEIVRTALASPGLASQSSRIAVSLDPLPPIPLDRALIGQVLLNLIENALKYAPPATEIRLSARIVGDSFEVAVADCGPGIPPLDRRHIFETFHRSSLASSVPGSGLGLSIAKGFVEAHGGTIRVSPNAPSGSVFTFTLPIHTAENTHEPRQRASLDRR